MSPGPQRGPDAIANGLAIAAKNAAAELRLGRMAVEGARARRGEIGQYGVCEG